MVEFALVIPLLLVLILAVLDFGRAIAAYNALSNAARQAAHYAASANTISCGVDATGAGYNQAVCLPARQAAIGGSALIASSSVLTFTVVYNPSLPNPLGPANLSRSWSTSLTYAFHPITGVILGGLTIRITASAQSIGQ